MIGGEVPFLATCEMIKEFDDRKMKRIQKVTYIIGIQHCENTDLQGNLVSVLTQNTKEKVKSSAHFHDIFFFLTDAVHVGMCNILSSLH